MRLPGDRPRYHRQPSVHPALFTGHGISSNDAPADMADEPVHQPRDKLFKTVFADPANAAAFLQGQIPPGFSAAMRWDELRLGRVASWTRSSGSRSVICFFHAVARARVTLAQQIRQQGRQEAFGFAGSRRWRSF